MSIFKKWRIAYENGIEFCQNFNSLNPKAQNYQNLLKKFFGKYFLILVKSYFIFIDHTPIFWKYSKTLYCAQNSQKLFKNIFVQHFWILGQILSHFQCRNYLLLIKFKNMKNGVFRLQLSPVPGQKPKIRFFGTIEPIRTTSPLITLISISIAFFSNWTVD